MLTSQPYSPLDHWAMGWIPNPYHRGELVVVIDCADLERATRFWTGVLGYVSAYWADR
jgi:hypothetical protein